MKKNIIDYLVIAALVLAGSFAYAALWMCRAIVALLSVLEIVSRIVLRVAQMAYNVLYWVLCTFIPPLLERVVKTANTVASTVSNWIGYGWEMRTELVVSWREGRV